MNSPLQIHGQELLLFLTSLAGQVTSLIKLYSTGALIGLIETFETTRGKEA